MVKEGRQRTSAESDRSFQHPALRFNKENVVHFRLQLPLGGDGLYVTAEDFRRYEKAANGLFDFVIEQFNSNENQYFPC